MDSQEERLHVGISIGHPGKHAAFHIDGKGHFICEDCGKDFSEELKNLKVELDKQVALIK